MKCMKWLIGATRPFCSHGLTGIMVGKNTSIVSVGRIYSFLSYIQRRILNKSIGE